MLSLPALSLFLSVSLSIFAFTIPPSNCSSSFFVILLSARGCLSLLMPIVLHLLLLHSASEYSSLPLFVLFFCLCVQLIPEPSSFITTSHLSLSSLQHTWYTVECVASRLVSWASAIKPPSQLLVVVMVIGPLSV